MGLSIFVVGITSSLFSFLKSVCPPDFTFYTTFRKESDPEKVDQLLKNGINHIEHMKDVHIDRVIWLSTHSDIPLMSNFAENYDTLAINSAIILDVVDPNNEYQQKKFEIHSIPKLYNFIPGFFIQDMRHEAWASKGLHGNSSKKIFDTTFDVDFNWKKSYTVTPLSHLCAEMIQWCINPKKFEKSTIICSERPYRRYELREFANIKHPFENLKPLQSICSSKVTEEMVILACRSAFFNN